MNSPQCERWRILIFRRLRMNKRISLLLIAVFVGFLIVFARVVSAKVPFYWDSMNVNIDV
jgi:hypothetical protein